MKMKLVCEKTGLSDRAVRHYIEEELLTPDFTENYLGRRTFDFAESDVARLRDIATLRKFGFSVPEIRDMLRSSEAIRPTVEALRTRKQAVISEEETLLGRLSQVDLTAELTVSELAAFLSRPVEELPAPPDREPHHVRKTIGRIGGGILMTLVAVLPVVITVVCLVDNLRYYLYAHISWPAVLLMLAALLPTVLFFLAHKLNKHPDVRTNMRWCALMLCLLCLPANFFISAFFVVEHSATENIEHYRKPDVLCPAYNDPFYHALFPLAEGDPVDTSGDYHGGYYRYSNDDRRYSYYYEDTLDYTYHIYAEWALDEDELEREVARVRKLFEEEWQDLCLFMETTESEYEKEQWQKYQFRIMQVGDWQCMALSVSPSGVAPFEEPEDGDWLDYSLFAYNEKTHRVRYIVNATQCAIGTPFYMTLDW